MTDNSLLRDFITETGEHLEELKAKICELDRQPDDVSLMNDIFRSIHTIKGSAEYLGLENLAVLSHKLENLLDLMRRGERVVDKGVLGLLTSANERIALLIDDLVQYESEKNSVTDLTDQINILTGEEVQELNDDPEAMARLSESVDENVIYGDEHDEELFEIFVDQLKDGLRDLCEQVGQLKIVETVEPVLEQCVERIVALRSSANYMGYDQLKDHYGTWLHQVAEVRDQLANGHAVDIGHFIDKTMFANIERVKGFFPKVDGFDQIVIADPDEKSAAAVEESESAQPSNQTFAQTIDEFEGESGFDISTQSLLADFITETSEHLESTESNLLHLEQHPEDIDLMNEIFRSIHTIKGSSEYLGLTRISELSHCLESLLDLLRRGERESSQGIVELLISANDRISQLVDDLEQHQSEKTQIQDLLDRLEYHTKEKVEIKESQSEIDTSAPDSLDVEILNEDEHDEELYGIFIKQLKDGLQGLYDEVKQLETDGAAASGLSSCLEKISTLRSSANYMGYEQLKEHYETWIRQVDEVRNQLADNQEVDIDRFLKTVMQANIKKVVKFFPKEDLLSQVADTVEHEPEASNERPAETEQEGVVPAEQEDVDSVEQESVDSAGQETYFDMGGDSLLADFIAETGEHLEDTERNLLLLEQHPDKVDLLNEIFRSIHTIKGSSEYLGLVRIAELSHKLESLLDRLRRGELNVGKDVIELLIGANDRISQLVDDLDRDKAEHTETNDLLDSIALLILENDNQQTASEPSAPQVVKFDHGLTVYEETYDQELFDIFIKHLGEGLQSLSGLLRRMKNSPAPIEQLKSCITTISRLYSSANYMEYEELKDFFDGWRVALMEVHDKLVEGDSVDFNAFIETPIKENIDTVYGIFSRFIEPLEVENDTQVQINDEIDVEEVYDDVTAHPIESADEPSPVPAPEEISDQNKDPMGEIDLIEKLENAFDARLGIGGERIEQALPFDVEGELLSEIQEGYSDQAFMGENSDLNLNAEPYSPEPDTLEAFLLSESESPKAESEVKQEGKGIEGDDEKKDLVSEALMQETETEVAPKQQPLQAQEAAEEVPQAVSEPEAAASVQGQVEEPDNFPVKPLSTVETGADSYTPPDTDSEERRRSYQIGRRKTDKFRERLMKQSIRVEAGKIDYLMNQVGELVVNRAGFTQIFNDMRELQLFLKQTQKLDKKEMQLVKELTNRISDATLTLGRVTSELQENVMKVRMLPIAQLFSRYPRLVHDLVRNTKKKVNLDVRGEETELDKMVIEQIADPMVHIIRNAVDHGIEEGKERQRRGKPETGTLRLEAYHEGNYVVIEISDDGRGINIEKVKSTALKNNFITQEELDVMDEQEVIALIMQPGFSTADEVTHTSGRGVGMDVVKDHIEKLSGTLDIHSTPGLGARIRIKIPLTLAIIPALMVTVSNEIFTIPLAAVDETIRIHRNDISSIEGLEVVYLRDATIPLIRLDEVFNMENTSRGEESFVVIVNTGAKKVGFIVDQLRGREEVVIKPLEDYLQEKSGFSGATILGDGSISLILDVFELVTLSINRHSNKIRATAV